MKKLQYAVIGLGRFGSSLAKELIQLGYEVLGVDKREANVEELGDQLTHVVLADWNDEEVFRSLGIRNFDCVVIAISEDIQASIMAAILCKEQGVKKVVAKAMSEIHGRVLQKVGVDRVIFPERDMGIRVAHQLASPSLLDYIELSKNYTIVELSVPGKISGKTLRELDCRGRFGCSIVAINRHEEVIVAPVAEDAVHENDVMVIIGSNQQIERFEDSIY
ncbi:MAG: potassium transporter Trk [Paenibacillaceae bacterium]|jgi:trk system potassium uptake protein TrkA|nr:potassium transporter Trk [Paenibacillaceae bacterium]